MMVFLWNRLTQGGLRERGGWTGRGENPRSLWRRLLQVPILLIPPTIIGTMTKTLCPGHEYMWYYITITMVWGGGRGFISTESKLASMAILDRTYLARIIFSYFVLKYKIIVCPFRDPRGGADPNEQTDSVRTPWTSSSAGSVSRSLFCLLLLSSLSLLLPASSLLLPSRLLWTLVAPSRKSWTKKREFNRVKKPAGSNRCRVKEIHFHSFLSLKWLLPTSSDDEDKDDDDGGNRLMGSTQAGAIST